MNDIYNRRLSLAGQPAALSLLNQCLHGIERETLRVTPTAELSLQDHPAELGSTLTHGSITTDYAEPLLEFITGAHANSADTLQELDEIHRFTQGMLKDELLWSPSMPCRLPDEQDIPIARYGDSTVGRFKYLYRLGLALRYGKTMQCIAGIHYNFSLPDAFWTQLQNSEADCSNPQDYQSERYIALCRNFRRYSWLLMYLFGASPAVDASFVRNMAHKLEQLDADTFYLPYATSLRMSDLGYQSNAQAGITPCYNSLQNYTDSLLKAVSTPYPDYVAQGTHDAKGQWQQINTNILQIENEYYSSIRPKRIPAGDERPVQALINQGIQYVEARCLDINPFLPLGIDLPQSRFLDSFLLYCALEDSPLFDAQECPETRQNFQTVVNRGRTPGLHLSRLGQPISLQDWANQLLEAIAPCARLLDEAAGHQEHSQALQLQAAKVTDSSLTPSAQLLALMQQNNHSFTQTALQLSQQHAQDLRARPLSAERLAHYQQLASNSHSRHQALESEAQPDFDSFMQQWG